MVRDDLENIPRFDLPPNYSLRTYRPGDEKNWTTIHQQADELNAITPQSFSEQFGSDLSLLADRQFYLTNGSGDAAGTGTAWFNKDFQDGKYGRVHWLAILPELQGQGLARPLMTWICGRLKELGHERACLTTSSERVKAIRLYLRFGFKPWFAGPEDQEAWEAMRRQNGLS